MIVFTAARLRAASLSREAAREPYTNDQIVVRQHFRKAQLDAQETQKDSALKRQDVSKDLNGLITQ